MDWKEDGEKINAGLELRPDSDAVQFVPIAVRLVHAGKRKQENKFGHGRKKVAPEVDDEAQIQEVVDILKEKNLAQLGRVQLASDEDLVEGGIPERVAKVIRALAEAYGRSPAANEESAIEELVNEVEEQGAGGNLSSWLRLDKFSLETYSHKVTAEMQSRLKGCLSVMLVCGTVISFASAYAVLGARRIETIGWLVVGLLLVVVNGVGIYGVNRVVDDVHKETESRRKVPVYTQEEIEKHDGLETLGQHILQTAAYNNLVAIVLGILLLAFSFSVAVEESNVPILLASLSFIVDLPVYLCSLYFTTQIVSLYEMIQSAAEIASLFLTLIAGTQILALIWIVNRLLELGETVAVFPLLVPVLLICCGVGVVFAAVFSFIAVFSENFWMLKVARILVALFAIPVSTVQFFAAFYFRLSTYIDDNCIQVMNSLSEDFFMNNFGCTKYSGDGKRQIGIGLYEQVDGPGETIFCGNGSQNKSRTSVAWERSPTKSLFSDSLVNLYGCLNLQCCHDFSNFTSHLDYLLIAVSLLFLFSAITHTAMVSYLTNHVSLFNKDAAIDKRVDEFEEAIRKGTRNDSLLVKYHGDEALPDMDDTIDREEKLQPSTLTRGNKMLAPKQRTFNRSGTIGSLSSTVSLITVGAVIIGYGSLNGRVINYSDLVNSEIDAPVVCSGGEVVSSISRCPPVSLCKTEHKECCVNGILDGLETDIDCGASCGDLCENEMTCSVGADCVSGCCVDGKCSPICPSTCSDGIQNNEETCVDGGGPNCVFKTSFNDTLNGCSVVKWNISGSQCDLGQGCKRNDDCKGDLLCILNVCTTPLTSLTMRRVARYIAPAQVTPKTLKNGEICTYNSECASFNCREPICFTNNDGPEATRGVPCLFPFKFNGGLFHGCTASQELAPPALSKYTSNITDYWCGTVESLDGNSDEWGFCDCSLKQEGAVQKRCAPLDPYVLPTCGVDCGSTADGDCCLTDSACESGVCSIEEGSSAGTCISCSDGIQNGDETDIDCGGEFCSPCTTTSSCASDSDCEENMCFKEGNQQGICVSCYDGIKNGDETCVDGGGRCATLEKKFCGPLNDGCKVSFDCANQFGFDAFCNSTTNSCGGAGDSVQNFDETDVDCGGGRALKCLVGQICVFNSDCLTGICNENSTCAVREDPIPDLCLKSDCQIDEEPCVEWGLGCAVGAAVGIGNGEICASGYENSGLCASRSVSVAYARQTSTKKKLLGIRRRATSTVKTIKCDNGGVGPIYCFNGKQDGDETDVDVGGGCRWYTFQASDGQGCQIDEDCVSNQCRGGICTSCYNGIKDGGESDIDCGGSDCPNKCFLGQFCVTGEDCMGYPDTECDIATKTCSKYCSESPCRTPLSLSLWSDETSSTFLQGKCTSIGSSGLQLKVEESNSPRCLAEETCSNVTIELSYPSNMFLNVSSLVHVQHETLLASEDLEVTTLSGDLISVQQILQTLLFCFDTEDRSLNVDIPLTARLLSASSECRISQQFEKQVLFKHSARSYFRLIAEIITPDQSSTTVTTVRMQVKNYCFDRSAECNGTDSFHQEVPDPVFERQTTIATALVSNATSITLTFDGYNNVVSKELGNSLPDVHFGKIVLQRSTSGLPTTTSPSMSPTVLPSSTPTTAPSSLPTESPTEQPSKSPTSNPTSDPTHSPSTLSPTLLPTPNPTRSPIVGTRNPTTSPTNFPSDSPTESPTSTPSSSPSRSPTDSPTWQPTFAPTSAPSRSPSESPTLFPSASPTLSPTKAPSDSPTMSPTLSPSYSPTLTPTNSPSKSPTISPTNSPSMSPTESPSNSPTKSPTDTPTKIPTEAPTELPSSAPTNTPTKAPTLGPTRAPSVTAAQPTLEPTEAPSKTPTKFPSRVPTTRPSQMPTTSPTFYPTDAPTVDPTLSPSEVPTTEPTWSPTTSTPTLAPTEVPSKAPTFHPTNLPSKVPTSKPTQTPTLEPTRKPTHRPTDYPTLKPTRRPSNAPTFEPSDTPTSLPSDVPTNAPTEERGISLVIDHIDYSFCGSSGSKVLATFSTLSYLVTWEEEGKQTKRCEMGKNCILQNGTYTLDVTSPSSDYLDMSVSIVCFDSSCSCLESSNGGCQEGSNNGIQLFGLTAIESKSVRACLQWEESRIQLDLNVLFGSCQISNAIRVCGNATKVEEDSDRVQGVLIEPVHEAVYTFALSNLQADSATEDSGATLRINYGSAFLGSFPPARPHDTKYFVTWPGAWFAGEFRRRAAFARIACLDMRVNTTMQSNPVIRRAPLYKEGPIDPMASCDQIESEISSIEFFIRSAADYFEEIKSTFAPTEAPHNGGIVGAPTVQPTDIILFPKNSSAAGGIKIVQSRAADASVASLFGGKVDFQMYPAFLTSYIGSCPAGSNKESMTLESSESFCGTRGSKLCSQEQLEELSVRSFCFIDQSSAWTDKSCTTSEGSAGRLVSSVKPACNFAKCSTQAYTGERCWHDGTKSNSCKSTWDSLGLFQEGHFVNTLMHCDKCNSDEDCNLYVYVGFWSSESPPLYDFFGSCTNQDSCTIPANKKPGYCLDSGSSCGTERFMTEEDGTCFPTPRSLQTLNNTWNPETCQCDFTSTNTCETSVSKHKAICCVEEEEDNNSIGNQINEIILPKKSDNKYDRYVVPIKVLQNEAMAKSSDSFLGIIPQEKIDSLRGLAESNWSISDLEACGSLVKIADTPIGPDGNYWVKMEVEYKLYNFSICAFRGVSVEGNAIEPICRDEFPIIGQTVLGIESCVSVALLCPLGYNGTDCRKVSIDSDGDGAVDADDFCPFDGNIQTEGDLAGDDWCGSRSGGVISRSPRFNPSRSLASDDTDLSVTLSGKECQMWSSQFPHEHSAMRFRMSKGMCGKDPQNGIDVSPCAFPFLVQKTDEINDSCFVDNDKSYCVNIGSDRLTRETRLACYGCSKEFHYSMPGLGNHNYCRTPDGDSRPWCFTTDPLVRWEYCTEETGKEFLIFGRNGTVWKTTSSNSSGVLEFASGVDVYSPFGAAVLDDGDQFESYVYVGCQRDKAGVLVTTEANTVQACFDQCSKSTYNSFMVSNGGKSCRCLSSKQTPSMSSLTQRNDELNFQSGCITRESTPRECLTTCNGRCVALDKLGKLSLKDCECSCWKKCDDGMPCGSPKEDTWAIYSMSDDATKRPLAFTTDTKGVRGIYSSESELSVTWSMFGKFDVLTSPAYVSWSSSGSFLAVSDLATGKVIIFNSKRVVQAVVELDQKLTAEDLHVIDDEYLHIVLRGNELISCEISSLDCSERIDFSRTIPSYEELNSKAPNLGPRALSTFQASASSRLLLVDALGNLFGLDWKKGEFTSFFKEGEEISDIHHLYVGNDDTIFVLTGSGSINTVSDSISRETWVFPEEGISGDAIVAFATLRTWW